MPFGNPAADAAAEAARKKMMSGLTPDEQSTVTNDLTKNSGFSAAWDSYKGAMNRDPNGYGGKLGQLGDSAAGFGRNSIGNFDALGREATGEREHLRRIARGDESVSRMQLAQALQQNQSQQQSMAAGARPGNAAMAARGAAMNAGRMGAGLAGQQAIAGIQERQAAQQALAQMLMQQRQQELGGVQTGFGAANQGYGTAYTGAMGTPSNGELGMNLIMSGLQGAALMSDERLKTNVKAGDKDADKLLRALKSKSYDYKDQKHGKGKQLGIMAQDLEAAGLGNAVFETPQGKAVHGAKLAAALASMMPGVNKRLEKLEGKK